jgi:hypothetical protein
VTDARRRPGLAKKTKPCRLISEISFTDDFQRHRAVQIDVERLVSDPHRAVSPATVQALKFWQDAIQQNVAPRNTLGCDGGDVIANLVSGFCAMQNLGGVSPRKSALEKATTEGGYSSAPMKLFKDLVVLTGRSEPRVPPEVYKTVSDTIQACQLGGADPMQAAEEGSQRAAVYERTTLERGPGEVLLLTQKIKADGKVYENGSRQTVAAIDGDKIAFRNGGSSFASMMAGSGEVTP